jgi:mRNA interferase MazF
MDDSIDLPSANGWEQRGRRPADILQDEQYAGSLPVVLVVPLTSARAALRFAGTTLIKPTPTNGLSQPSVALVFQFRAIDRHRIKEKIGTISVHMRRAIFDELDRLTGRAK